MMSMLHTDPANESQQRKSIGILIVEENVGLAYTDFIRAACPNQAYPTHVFIKWGDSSRRQEEGVHLLYGSYGELANTHYDIHLFGLPQALLRNFSIGELEFSIKTCGYIVLVEDVEDILSLDVQKLNAYRNDPLMSGLTWVRNQNSPVAVISIAHENTRIDERQLRNILSLPIQTPLIVSSKNIDKQQIEQILWSLIRQIETIE